MVMIEVKKKEISFEEIYAIIHKHFKEYGFEFSNYLFPLIRVGIKTPEFKELIFYGEYIYKVELLEEGLTITSFNSKFTKIAKLLEPELKNFNFRIVIEEDF